MSKYPTICVIPDTQVKADVPLDHLEALGNYLVEKQPDYVVQIGDWYDMPSLSSYDEKKAGFETRDYKADIDAGNEAMRILEAPIAAYNKGKRGKNRYEPKKIMTLGNHDNRINRFREDAINARFRNVVTQKDFELDGWQVVPFLKIIKVCGTTETLFVVLWLEVSISTRKNTEVSKTLLSGRAYICCMSVATVTMTIQR
jgi:hypothetical protein